MIQVQIGGITKDVKDVSSSWLHEQLDRRRRDNQPVCVQVRIDTPQVRMTLRTPDCPSPAGGREANPQEKRIFELWEKLRLNSSEFTGGNLMAFLRQVA